MNLIWFVIDTLRSDHLGCYGYFRDTSPTMDRLAAQGVLFEQSYASAIATGPGFSCLISGRHAINHGFYITPWNVPNAGNFDDEVPTLAEMVWEAGGITTVAFDNLINFRSHMKQFVRGFEFYINVTRTPNWIHHRVVGDQINERALSWLRHYGREPFFMLVHYWDPHTPYNQPDADLKLIEHVGSEGIELHDLAADPMETVNLAAEREHERQEMRDLLHSWVERQLGERPDPMVETHKRWSVYPGGDHPL